MTFENVKRIDETGHIYGKLTVIEPAIQRPIKEYKSKGFLWTCQCSCGKKCTVLGCDLRAGNKRSCGRCQGKVSAYLSICVTLEDKEWVLAKAASLNIGSAEYLRRLIAQARLHSLLP